MTITEIKEMITNLLYYEDSEISHVIADRFKISYSKPLQSFQIYDIKSKKMIVYQEVELASLALYNLLYPNKS